MQVARMPSAVVLGGTRPDRGGCPPEFRRRLVLQSWSHSDGPALPRVPAGFSPAFWRMARPIITVHGVHSNDEETRLGALSDDVRFDVLQGSWLHDALSLDHYPNNSLAPQYTAVPAHVGGLSDGADTACPHMLERRSLDPASHAVRGCCQTAPVPSLGAPPSVSARAVW